MFDLQSKRFIHSPSGHFCENEFHEWENHKNQYLHTNIDTEDEDLDNNDNDIEGGLNDNIDPDKVQVGEIQNERFLNEIKNLLSKRERKPRKIIDSAESN